LKVKEILSNAYKVAYDIISKNKKLHEKMSQDLLEKEEIDREEFAAYFAST
jgi:ATP-dependent Zn protease